jgi:hypothetical protein
VKITITVSDTDPEGEGVRIDSDPDFRVLVRIAHDKGRELTPAVAYAMRAISIMIADAKKQTEEKVKAKFDAGLIPAIPSTRNMFS